MIIKLLTVGCRDPTDLRGTLVLGPFLLCLGLRLGLQSNLPAGERESHLCRARYGPLMEEGVIMLYLMMLLNQLKMDAFRFKKDEDGAALIEYTVLLGILIVAVIATIGLVGAWINGQWHALQSQLS